MANTRRYSQEFKDEAVKLVTENGYSLAEAARQVSIPNSILWQWVNKVKKPDIVGVESFPDIPAAADEHRRLRKEGLRLQEKNKIFKKTTAFFAKESLQDSFGFILTEQNIRF